MAREKRTRGRSRMGSKVRRKAEKALTRNTGGSYVATPTGVDNYKPKKGTHSLQIVPYEVSVDNHPQADKGELWYQRDILVHYNVGIEEKAVICPKTIGKSCPICKHLASLKKDPDADEEIIKALKPRERELFNVIDPEEDPDKVMLFEVSYYNFGEKLDEELRDGKPEWNDFAEPEDGYELSVRWKEERLGKTNYLKASRIDFEERDDYTEEILDSAIDLDKALVILPYNEIEKLLFGEPVDEEEYINNDDDDYEEERPKRKKRSKRETVEDDPEDAPEDYLGDGEEEEEEEEKPKRKRKSKKEVKDEVEEEDNDDNKEVETSKTKSLKNTNKETEKCPFGFKFGVDIDNEDECEKCDKWDECMDHFEELEKAKRGK